MGSFIVVVIDPLVQIDLQLLDGLIDLLAECDLIELLQDGLVETLADAVGLRWQWRGFKAFWLWRFRGRPGQPRIPREARDLVGEVSFANPLWGCGLLTVC